MDGKQRKTLKFKGENLFIEVSQYRSNGRIAILSYTEEEPYSDITINLTGMCLDEDEGAINSLAKSCGLEKALIKNGIIKEDGSDIENIPYKETNNYVRKILRDYKIYQELYQNNE